MMCFYKAAKETEFLEDLDSYFHDRLDSVCDKLDIDKADDSEGTFGNLKNLIDGMQVYFGKKTDKAEAQRITRILEGCRNPYSDPESLVSKEKEEEEKRIQEEKRSKKIKINHEKSAQLAKVFN